MYMLWTSENSFGSHASLEHFEQPEADDTRETLVASHGTVVELAHQPGTEHSQLELNHGLMCYADAPSPITIAVYNISVIQSLQGDDYLCSMHAVHNARKENGTEHAKLLQNCLHEACETCFKLVCCCFQMKKLYMMARKKQTSFKRSTVSLLSSLISCDAQQLHYSRGFQTVRVNSLLLVHTVHHFSYLIDTPSTVQHLYLYMLLTFASELHMTTEYWNCATDLCQCLLEQHTISTMAGVLFW